MTDKRLLIEIKLVEESKYTTSKEIIDDVYYDIAEGRCIIPWCASVLKVVQV